MLSTSAGSLRHLQLWGRQREWRKAPTELTHLYQSPALPKNVGAIIRNPFLPCFLAGAATPTSLRCWKAEASAGPSGVATHRINSFLSPAQPISLLTTLTRNPGRDAALYHVVQRQERTFRGFMKYHLGGRKDGSRQKRGRGGGAEWLDPAGGSSRGAGVGGGAEGPLPAQARRDERDSGSD